MHSASNGSNTIEPVSNIEKLRSEVNALAEQYTALELQHLRSSILWQKLGHAFGFGATGKLEWANFKLKFKQEELAELECQQHDSLTSTSTPDTALNSRTPETMRQKMERMILLNPAELEPHFRRVYLPLIVAEQIGAQTAPQHY